MKERYWRLVRENRGTIVLLSILSCLLSLFFVGFAYLSKLLLDSIGQDVFLYYAIAMGVIIVLEVILKLSLNIYYTSQKAKLENKIKKETLFHFLNNDYRKLDTKNGGDWLNRITSDAKVVADGVITYLPNFISLVSRIVLSFAVLCYVDWIFALVLLGLGGIAYLASYFMRPYSKKLHKDSQQREGEVLSFYKDSINNGFLLKLFSRKDKISKQCDAIQDKYADAKVRFAKFSIFINTGFTFFMRLSYLGAIIYASVLISRSSGTYGYGNMLVMVELISQIEGPFSSLSGLLPQYYQTLGSLERISECEAPDQQGLNKASTFSLLSLKDVSFGYEDGAKIIETLNAEISPQDFVLISGPSGRGKTTLLKLIMGAYSPDSGKVLVDDVPSSQSQSLFAYVPQGNYLLPTTIRDNLTLFGDATDEDIYAALSVVCLKEKVMSLNKKLDTELHDLGNGLSEGEGQRLSIARALISQRPILILDECTSALDENTATSVLQNLKATNKTIIMVSHKGESKSFATKEIAL